MKWAVSNIAWKAEQDTEALALLAHHGVRHVEFAPARFFHAPELSTGAQRGELRKRYEGGGFKLASAQALLFAKPELRLFGSAEEESALSDYLEGIIRFCAELGAGPLVFGSPKARQRGGLGLEAALERAAKFFRRAGEVAVDCGACLVLEPNPAAYGCDFIQTAEEGAELVERAGSKGFALHLDMAGLQLAGQDPALALAAHAGHLRHAHLSAPQLGEPGLAVGVDYRAAVAALRQEAYTGLLSIEMRSTASPKGDLEQLERVLRFVQSLEPA